jgi:hypothetical protein
MNPLCHLFFLPTSLSNASQPSGYTHQEEKGIWYRFGIQKQLTIRYQHLEENDPKMLVLKV